MRNLIYFLTVLFAVSCQSSEQDSLETDSTIKSVFNSSELTDLLKVQHFFDRQISITDKISESNLDESYHHFFQRLAKVNTAGDLLLPINFNKQKEFYQQIDKYTFDQIWLFDSLVNMATGDTLMHIQLNGNGKYLQFLKKLGGQNKVIKDYVNGLEIAGDISPSMIAVLVKNYSKYDIKDPKIRLMVAIHYLTLNDQWTRNEIKSEANTLFIP